MEQIGYEYIYNGPERGVHKTFNAIANIETWCQDSKLHRDYGPAFTNHKANTETWYQDGKLHREHGPAFINHKAGTEKWYENDELHRIDGPAITYSDGTERWYQNNKRHRAGGPAIIHPDGSEEWWLDGKRHNDIGPAKIHPNGNDYWIEGKKLTEDQFLRYKKVREKSVRRKIFPIWHALKEETHGLFTKGELKRRFDEMQELDMIDQDEEFDEELMRNLQVRSSKLEDRFNEMQAHGIIDPDERFDSNKFIREQWEIDKTIRLKKNLKGEIYEDINVYDDGVYDDGVYDEIVMIVDSNGEVTYEKVSSLK